MPDPGINVRVLQVPAGYLQECGTWAVFAERFYKFQKKIQAKAFSITSRNVAKLLARFATSSSCFFHIFLNT